MHKIKDRENVEYSNPYGKGERWTSTDNIDDFQPIFNIAIRRMEIYNKSCETPILKSKEVAYICEMMICLKKEALIWSYVIFEIKIFR